MITIDGANAYFSTRTVNDLWRRYTVEQRKAAIEQAKRDLARALGRALDEDELPFRYTDRTRDEYAAYEQALHSLRLDCEPGATDGSVLPLEEAPDLPVERCRWSSEALSWLGAPSRVQTVMG